MIPKGGDRLSDAIMVYLFDLAAFVRREVVPSRRKMP